MRHYYALSRRRYVWKRKDIRMMDVLLFQSFRAVRILRRIGLCQNPVAKIAMSANSRISGSASTLSAWKARCESVFYTASVIMRKTN